MDELLFYMFEFLVHQIIFILAEIGGYDPQPLS